MLAVFQHLLRVDDYLVESSIDDVNEQGTFCDSSHQELENIKYRIAVFAFELYNLLRYWFLQV